MRFSVESAGFRARNSANNQLSSSFYNYSDAFSAEQVQEAFPFLELTSDVGYIKTTITHFGEFATVPTSTISLGDFTTSPTQRYRLPLFAEKVIYVSLGGFV